MKRTRTLTMLLGVLALAVLTSGCATYGAKGVMPSFSDPASLNAGTKVPTKMGGGVIASAYPLISAEENKKYFDENLLESGVVAIFLEVQNDPVVKGNEKMRLIAATLEMEEQKDSQGNIVVKKASLRAMAAQDVFGVLKRSWGARGVAWGLVTVWVGLPISKMATDKTNQDIQEDMENGKILDLSSSEIGTIDPLRGFLCFRAADKELPFFPRATLKLTVQKEKKFMEYNLPIL